MDSRARIEICFKIYGREFKWDASINYFPDSDGLDNRIREWFAQKHDEARAAWEAERWEADRAAREAAEEKAEREELARLKAKYEEGP